MSEKAVEKSCIEFIDMLASNAPAPGGGGAAALVGAVGTALGNMVGSLTLGKKKYAEVQDEISGLKKSSDKLQKQLLDLVAKDAEAFEPLSKAYGMPSTTEKEKAQKEEVMEAALKRAAMVPYEIMESITEAIELVERFAAIGSRLAISDAGCAAACLRAALNAAALNVFINTRLMKDRVYAEAMNKRAEDLIQLGSVKADAVYDTVRDSLL